MIGAFYDIGQIQGFIRLESKTGKQLLSRWRVAPKCCVWHLNGLPPWQTSNLACYPILCLVSSPLYFTVLLLLSSSVVNLSYCFRYCYCILLLLFIVVMSCFSVSYCFLLLFACLSFLLSIVVIFKFVTFLIICCCY